VHALAWHPDGDALGSACSDGGVRLWDLRSGALAQAHSGDAGCGAARALAFHPLGACLASGGADGGVRLWDLRRAALAYSLLGHDGAPAPPAARRTTASGVLGCAFSPRGDFLASGGADAQVLVWRTNAAELTGAAAPAAQQQRSRPAASPPRAPPAASPALSPSPVPPPWRTAGGWSPSPIPAALLARPHAPTPPEPTPEPEDEAAGEFTLRRLPTAVRAQAPQAPAAAASNASVADALAVLASQMSLVQQTLGLLDARMTIQETQLARLSDRC
jgi:centriolar protein POC1